MIRNDHDWSNGWLWKGRVWRARWSLQVWCHRNVHFGDRWVFQPSFTWDRRP